MANGFDPNQSSVEFGMGLLEKTQKDIRRRQKEAQRVNKFVALKKLTESALSGVVTNKWNDFEQQEKYKKIQLNNIIDTNKEVFEREQEIQEQSKGDREQYFLNELYGYVVADQQNMFPNQELTGQGKAYLMSVLKPLAQQRAKEWEEILEHAKKIPTNIEGLDADWDYYRQSQVPTSVGNWLTRGIRQLFDGKTKEEYEREQLAYRDNVMSNEGLFKDYVRFKEEYDSFLKSNPSVADDIFEEMTKNYNQDKQGALLQNKRIGEPKIEKYAVTNATGTYTKFVSLTPYIDENGREYYEKKEILEDRTKAPSPINIPAATDNDFKMFKGVAEVIASEDENQTGFTKFYQDNFDPDSTPGKLSDKERVLYSNAHMLSQQMQLLYGVPQNEANNLAMRVLYGRYGANFTAGRGVSFPVDTSISLYQLDNLRTDEFDLDTFIDVQAKNYLQDYARNGISSPMTIYVDTKDKILTGLQEDDGSPALDATKFEAIKRLQRALYDSDEDYLKDFPGANDEVLMETIKEGRVSGAGQTGASDLLTSEDLADVEIPEPKQVENVFESIAKKGAAGIRYVDFFDYIPKLDLSAISSEELDALYNISKGDIRRKLDMPEDIDLSRTALQRNTFREAIEVELKKREKEEGVAYIAGYYPGEKSRRVGLIESDNVNNNFWIPLLKLIVK